VKNNLENLKQQYIEKHRILNEDFNMFLDFEIKEENQRDEEFFRRLKEPSVVNLDDRQEEVRMTSTCVNTLPLPEPHLESSFKRKAYSEYQREFDEWMQEAQRRHTSELEQEIAKR
jgi:hypothetical protein